jgi:thiol-disulfide isomerase/thioredoxin
MPQQYPISRRTALASIGGLAIPSIAFALNHGDPAPKFRARTMDGESINNESLRGKVVLIQFWATWCPYCKRDMPALEAIGREFAAEGLVIYGVNFAESKKKVKLFLEQSPRSSKVILLEDTNLAAVFDAKAFPMYVLIDRKGNLAGTQKGAGGEPSLRHLLRKAALNSPDSQVADEVIELDASPRRE